MMIHDGEAGEFETAIRRGDLADAARVAERAAWLDLADALRELGDEAERRESSIEELDATVSELREELESETERRRVAETKLEAALGEVTALVHRHEDLAAECAELVEANDALGEKEA